MRPVSGDSPADEKALPRLRVLVLEPGTIEGEALNGVLRSLGLEPTWVCEAGAAVEELHRAAGDGRPYDVVLLDSSMRGSAAFRARRREDDAVLADTPRVWLWSQAGLETDAPRPHPRVLRPVTRDGVLAALQQALRPPEPTGRGAAADRARVLVVDDNPVRALVASRLVELAGGEAVVAPRPDAIGETLATRTIAAVVLDRARPEHRACEARLREIHPEIAVLPAPVAEVELREALTRHAPPAVPAPVELPFDRARLVRNLGDDAEAADRVLSAFVGQAAGSLESLRGAHEAGDLASIARAAHRLKGSLLWIGADRAAREAGSLEQRANEGDGAAARTVLAIVEGEVRAVVAAIRAASSS